MKTIRLLLLPAFALVILIAPAAAQETTDNGISSKWPSGGVKYPRLDKQFRFAVDAGYSYGASVINDYDEVRTLSGVNFGIDVMYFPRQAWGFGAKFNLRSFAKKTDEYDYRPSTRITFYGVTGVWRKFDRRNKNALLLGYSMGVMDYKESARDGSWTLSESTIGFGSSLDIGYDLRLGERTFLGFKVSFGGGVFDLDYEYYDGYYNDGTYYIDNFKSFIDFSVGFRF